MLNTWPLMRQQSPGCWHGDAAGTSAILAATHIWPPVPPAAERRQLTVLFCDLVDSTALAGRLDPRPAGGRAGLPTDLRAVIQRFEAILPSISAMACWCTLAILRRMKTMRSARCRPG